MSILYWN